MKLVDLFAREYGWTVEDVKRLTLSQSHELQRVLVERIRRQNKQANRSGRRG